MTLLLPIAEAQARLFALAPRVATEALPLAQAAHRWVAQDVHARRTQPITDLSAMDGYAIRYADLPGPFRLTGESAAGHAFTGQLEAGEAVRIFTGAAMPPGADSVLIQEEATADGATITLSGEGPLRQGGNVRLRGLDFSEGSLLVASGHRLNPARLALAALGGHSHVTVARKIRVAIAATGDELSPPGDPDPTKLPESNGTMLAAMLAGLPVEIIDLGILPDDLEILRDAFAGVDADLLVTTGGASVGDHDLVRPALEAAGGTIDFWRIALRPGKPMMAGRMGKTMVLGLPGNPVSAFVTALLFVKPVIAAMSGAADPLPATLKAPLAHPLRANNNRQDYMRAAIVDGRVSANAVQDSSMLAALARSDCLIIRAPNAPAAAVDEIVDILPLA